MNLELLVQTAIFVVGNCWIGSMKCIFQGLAIPNKSSFKQMHIYFKRMHISFNEMSISFKQIHISFKWMQISFK